MGRGAKKQIGLVGRKVGMTQVFSERGDMVPVTVLKVGPCRVVRKIVKTSNGYDAIQVGFEEVTKKRGMIKPLAGQFRKADLPLLRVMREIRGMPPGEYEIGQELRADLFQVGDRVSVQGFSKGRGFTGGVKRHGYRGGRATHGSMFHRAPGSIGASSFPSRVFKGKRLPGRMGNERVTVKGLQVMGVDPEKDVIIVKGAVPGPNHGMVVVTAKKE